MSKATDVDSGETDSATDDESTVVDTIRRRAYDVVRLQDIVVQEGEAALYCLERESGFRNFHIIVHGVEETRHRAIRGELESHTRTWYYIYSVSGDENNPEPFVCREALKTVHSLDGAATKHLEGRI